MRKSLLAAWAAFVLSGVITLTLGAGGILLVMTGMIALSLTAMVVTQRGSTSGTGIRPR
ncbi:hypothetical protein [Nesterenkonia halotolerans]|uniref:Na+/phosphate symporter n=1 Tax=Nesterenkonia halotolerans TaxID=225325 RepID=A0ABR9J5I0_9MICC|nr:hypothetical protein [Nesterenkonia halotolerans]MBE1514122.1 Na+/phosphate symporter [Nesterenkonia halotolerans]